MRMESNARSPGGGRRPGQNRAIPGVRRQAVNVLAQGANLHAETPRESANASAPDETAHPFPSGGGFSDACVQRLVDCPGVEEDWCWDVFLADDPSEEPQPEQGDFWLDGP